MGGAAVGIGAERRFIGIDIGGTNLRAARVTGDGRIEALARAPSSPDPALVLARCLALAAEVGTPQVAAIGIGIPGQVDARARRVISGGYADLSGRNFPGGTDFAGAISTATGLPVVIDNDATMALLAESAFGAARGRAQVALLTIGTGIGGALLMDGEVLRGGGFAGQLGHMVIDPAGRACVCGRRGCVETTSSGTAFGLHLAEAGLPATTRAEDLLARGDAQALAVLRAWAGPLRQAVDTLIAVLNPDCVVIGGGAGAAALAALAQVPARPSWFAAPVLAAELGDDAGVIGAAVAAMRAAAPLWRGKRAVLVNGVPASGKSGVARALSAATGWPILTLDTIKNPFLTELPPGDRLFNRMLGRASYAAIFDLIRDAPPGSSFIIDAWFGFQPLDLLAAGITTAGLTDLAEIWCHAPPETIGARYGARVGSRPAGHPGPDYVPELIALAQRARPTGIAPVIAVETTAPLDCDRLTGWLAGLWPGTLG